MAICTFQQPFEKVRGTFRDDAGGIVAYDTTKSGNIIRNWVMPTNPKSTLQTAVRADFSASATAYKALTAAQALAWTIAAAEYKRQNNLGTEYIFSGINLFVQVNSYRRMAGETPTTAVPIIQTFPFLDIPGSTFTAPVVASPYLEINLQSVTTNAGAAEQNFLSLFTGPWTATARKPRRNDYAMRVVSPTYGNFYSIPPGADTHGVDSMSSDTILVKSGDKIWVSILGLSSDFVPAPSPDVFEVTLTTTP